MSILAKTSVLLVIMFLMLPVTVDGTDEPRYKILKFGQTEDDYVMFTHDMSQFETGFTLCAWVRKLYSQHDPTWFSYAISGQHNELGMTDRGTQTRIFGYETSLTNYYTVTPGTWFHNCLSWDNTTSTRDVYINGVRVNSKATPAGRTLGQGGTIVLGNEQGGVGTGMDEYDIFGGELYKLNMFTRKLSNSEIKEMSEERCSVVEMKYGEERGIKWKDVLQKTKNGNVVELEVDSQCKSLIHVWHNLQIAAIAGYEVLKFGQNVNDYVMFQHDMSQFETGFTVCSWVRKLRNVEIPTWFSYAVSYNERYEIQISDMGDRTRIFGDGTNLASLYTVTPGTWFHNCLSWDSATSTRDVYIDGVRIDSKATPAGRKLGQGGTIVLGNEQDGGPGLGMDSANTLSGELFKLNMFTRKLDESEIKEMSMDMCSEVEMKYGDERGLKWEDVLQKTRHGYVTEISIGPQCKSLNYVWNKLQETDTELNNAKNTNVEQENAITELSNTIHKQQNDIIDLNSTIREEKSSILQLTRKLNNTINGNKVLKFGQSSNDYVMFQQDMSEFETGFTVCSWVRKLRNVDVPTWFSYAVNNEKYEIQISDMGRRTRIFGDDTNLASLYTVTPGTWFHNCLSWDSATSTRDVYINGVKVNSAATTSGRTLRQEGTIVLGNEQQSGPGAGMDDYNMFWGELYKLNMFTRKLNESEIKKMSMDMCSEVEMKYERGIKWEDVLKKSKNGNVTEISIGQCKSLNYVWNKLQETDTELNNTKNTNVEQENAITELNNTIFDDKNRILAQENATSELNNTIHKQQNEITELNSTIREEKSSILQLTRKLNNTINGNKVLKFGQSSNDYVMFQQDMSQFETGFTVCSWVRKLRNAEVPTWFSYAVNNEKYEIQISDMGDRTRIFGVTANLASLYTVTPGTWFHNCLSWDSATSTRNVYIDGVRIDSAATPAGRTLGQGGTIVLGNEQQRGPGLGMDSFNILSGELFKLNMFTRKLDESEIKEMSMDMCSEVEMKYGRGIKWEDVLKKSKNGIVTEISIGPQCKSLNYVWNKLQETDTELNNTKNTNVEQETAIIELNNTIFDEKNRILAQKKATSELNITIHKQQNDITKLNNTIFELNSTIVDEKNRNLEQKKAISKLNITILEEKSKIAEQENAISELNNTILEDIGNMVEHTNFISELNGTMIEEKSKIAEQENEINEQRTSLTELNMTIIQQKSRMDEQKRVVKKMNNTIVEEKTKVLEQKKLISDLNVTILAEKLNRVTDQRAITGLNKTLLEEMIKILEQKSAIAELNNTILKEKNLNIAQQSVLAKLNNTIIDEKSNNVAQQDAIAELNSTILEEKSNNVAQQDAIAELNSTILEEKSNNAAQQDAIAELNSTILEEKSNNVAQQDAIAELNSTILEEKSNNAAQQDAIAELNSTILEEKSNNVAQQDAIAELNSTILEEKSNNVAQQDAIAELNSTILEEKSNNVAQQDAVAELNSTILEEKSNNVAQQDAIAELNSTILEEKSNNVAQQDAIAELNSTILEEKSNNVAQQDAITELKNTIIEEKGAIAELNNTILKEKGAITELNNTLLKERSNNAAQQDAIAELNSTILEEKDAIAELNSTILKEKGNNVAQQDAIAELSSTILKEKGNNVAQQDAIAELNSTILEEKDAIAELNSTILEEKSNNVAQQDAIAELNSTILEEKSNNVAQQDAIAELNSTILEEKGAIAELNSTILKEKGNNVAQQDAIAELSSTILKEKGNNVAQQDAIAELNSTILEEKDAIAELNSTILEEKDAIAELNSTILQEKGNNVAQKNAIVQLNNTILEEMDSIAELKTTILEEMNAIKELNNIILGLKNVVDDRKNAEVQKNVTQTQLQGKIHNSLFKFSLF